MPYLTGDKGSDPCTVILKSVPSDTLFLAALRGAISELASGYIWEQFGTATPSEAASEFSRSVQLGIACGECDCTDCEENPGAIINSPGIGGNGSGFQVGITGLTIDELESIVMSAITDIRCNNGVWEVMRFGCCEWETIDCGSSVVQTYDGKDPQTITPPDWVELGEPSLGGALGAPIAPAYVENESAYRCLKATGYAYGIKALVDKWLELYEAIDLLNPVTLAGVGAAVSASFASWGSAAVAAAAGAIVTVITEISIDDAVADLQTMSDLDEFYPAMICGMTAVINPSQEWSYGDAARASEVFEAAMAGIGEGDNIAINCINLVPMAWLTVRAQQEAFTRECECETYLPTSISAPSAPPVSEGDFRFDFWGVGIGVDPTDIHGLPTTLAGAAFEAAFAGETGLPWNGLLQTEELGITNGNYNSYASAVLDMSGVVDLSELRIYGFLEASGGNPYVNMWGFDASTQLWKYLGSQSGLSNSGGSKSYAIALTATNITWMLFSFKTRDNPGIDFFITDIRLTGTFDGGTPFTYLPVGVLLSEQ